MRSCDLAKRRDCHSSSNASAWELQGPPRLGQQWERAVAEEPEGGGSATHTTHTGGSDREREPVRQIMSSFMQDTRDPEEELGLLELLGEGYVKCSTFSTLCRLDRRSEMDTIKYCKVICSTCTRGTLSSAIGALLCRSTSPQSLPDSLPQQ